MEVWKDITEDNRFQVSNTSVIRRKSFTSRNRHGEFILPGKIKTQSISGSGYSVINIAGKVRLVHRLKAIEFIPNPDNLPCINHIDGNKLNNDLTNLEWCTRKHNNQHAYDNGLKQGYWKGKTGYDNASSKEVIMYDLDMKEIKRFGSASEAARKTGLQQSGISRCARGLRDRYANYKWGYINTLK